MKINGRVPTPYEIVKVFPRQDGNLVFKFRAVMNMGEYDEQFPRPTAPKKLVAGIGEINDFQNPTFAEALNRWCSSKADWVFLKSIAVTDGLEWATVDMSDPTTFRNYINDFLAVGVTDPEIATLMRAANEVNGLNDEKIEEATQSFLASLVAQAKG